MKSHTCIITSGIKFLEEGSWRVYKRGNQPVQVGHPELGYIELQGP